MATDCVIVACHDRMDDLSVQLELQAVVAAGAKVVLVHTGHGRLPDGPRDGEVEVRSGGPRTGPVQAMLAGLCWAADNGCRAVVYRNADDWMMNPDTHRSASESMRFGMAAAGYNWLSRGTFDDFALNELWLDVGTFAPHAGSFGARVEAAGAGDLCERLAAELVRRHGGGKGFLRFAEREASPPIGVLDRDLRISQMATPERFLTGFWAVRAENSRFFCRRWRLIGFHDNADRFSHWCRLRPDLVGSGVEEGPAFSRWLHHAENGLVWNGKRQRVGAAGVRAYRLVS